MATVEVRRYDDTSAPTIDGQNGSLITALDAILVNGYGSESALGWTKSYSGTNKAVYRGDTTNGTGFYIRIDDGNATTTRAEIRGYETMTGVDTGSNAFPTTDTMYITKSNSADSTARPWMVYGDDYGVWLLIYIGSTSTGGSSDRAAVYFFGDFVTKDPDDSYNCVVSGHSDGSTYPYFFSDRYITDAPYTSGDLTYVARKADGTGSGGDNSIKLIGGADFRIAAASLNSKLMWSSFGGLDDCAARTYRGFLPAVHICLHDYTYMTDDSSHGDFQYHNVGYSSTLIDGILFDVTKDFRVHI